jgi:hypothetical protein
MHEVCPDASESLVCTVGRGGDGGAVVAPSLDARLARRT